ncbi:MAG: aldehyde dehydrogenase [Thermus sp.]|uniref:aldehyde dehydrogenase n=2 Tax=Thermus sp. TaxID=275 RepID=UPI0025FB1A22|nr:aldehyde dehydrogenase [Thermus sp.]MCS7219144.1 aldehyde dehydrogenase [Thermus sp.]MDW8017520.1 aldehyde dehydrogenase [Thermus sp.]MDW8357789.1 aldehyde dehydrogenase [Thermus sp.]
MTQTAKHVGLYIAGAWRPAQEGRRFQRRSPLDGQAVSEAEAAGLEDARQAVEAALEAFPTWSETPPSQRRDLLWKAAEALEARLEAFVEAMVEETGATPGWAHLNVHLAAGMLKEAAALTTQITGEVIPSDRPGTLAFAVRQPVGVILSLAPWNAPVILGVRALATPLACGNTVVFKGSELSPRTHALIVEALAEAGLPPGVVNFLTTAPEDAPRVVEALIAHPGVRRVNFTGSTRTGRIIAELAGRHLKPVLLELGGKAPAIVLKDADLEAAARAIAFGAFANQGQICMSTERVVVEEAVADALVERLAQRAASLPVGDPRTGQAALGCLVEPKAAERVASLVEEALAQGARLVAGGRKQGPFFWPTVLDRVTPKMRIYHEESFGPVAVVVRVADEEEAVRVANDTEYGLSAAIFTRDIAKGLKLAKRVQSGICHINGPTVHDEPQMPFGGVKASGYGRFGGRAGIHEFTELRWITVQTEPLQFPF